MYLKQVIVCTTLFSVWQTHPFNLLAHLYIHTRYTKKKMFQFIPDHVFTSILKTKNWNLSFIEINFVHGFIIHLKPAVTSDCTYFTKKTCIRFQIFQSHRQMVV